MYVFHRFLLWIVPFLWVFGLELVKTNYNYWWQVIVFLIIYNLIVLWFACKQKINKNFFHFLIMPIILMIGSFLFLFFSASVTLYHVLVVLTGLVLYSVFRQYYLFFYFPLKYQPYSLESLTWYISLFSGYFILSSAFGALSLLKINIFLILGFLFVVFSLMIYYFFWINKIDWAKNRIFVGIIVLILLEMFVAVSYLPTIHYVNAFILTIALYVMLGLSKLFLNNGLTRKKVFNYLLISGFLVAVVLATAQWI